MKKAIKLITRDSERVSGFKTLTTLPESLKGIELTSNAKIIDTGNLTNYRNFMIEAGKHRREDGKASATKYDSTKWSGTSTWAEYIEILKNGDDHLMKKIKTKTKTETKNLEKQYKEVVSDYKFDVTGQFFDVGLVISGVPESWLEPEYAEEEVVRVDIVLNGAYNWKFDQEVMSSNIARILAMIKVLENHKVEVKIVLVSGNGNYDRKHREDLIVMTNLKGYSEPINYSKMTSLLNPAYHRRGILKIIEMQADKVGEGYSRPLRYGNGVINLLDNNDINDLEHRLFKREK